MDLHMTRRCLTKLAALFNGITESSFTTQGPATVCGPRTTKFVLSASLSSYPRVRAPFRHAVIHDGMMYPFPSSFLLSCTHFFFGKRFKIIVGLFREGNGTGVTDAPRSIHFYPLLRIAWHGSKALKTEPMACVARYILARAFNIPSWFSFDSNAFGAVFREFFLTIGVKYHLFDRLSIVSVFFFASCVFCKFLYIQVLHKYPQSNDRLTR